MYKQEYNYKQGDVVYYNLTSDLHGSGRIVGVSTTGAPIIGLGYIIEDLSGRFPNEVYPFTHLVAFESQLTKA